MLFAVIILTIFQTLLTMYMYISQSLIYSINWSKMDVWSVFQMLYIYFLPFLEFLQSKTPVHSGHTVTILSYDNVYEFNNRTYSWFIVDIVVGHLPSSQQIAKCGDCFDQSCKRTYGSFSKRWVSSSTTCSKTKFLQPEWIYYILYYAYNVVCLLKYANNTPNKNL